MKQSTDEAFKDINEFIKLWQQEVLKKYLVAEFGEDALDFTPLSHRINAFGHDRHIIKFHIFLFEQNNVFVFSVHV